MKRLFFLFILLTASILSQAGNYKSFKVSVYTRAYEVEKMKDLHWLDSTWTIISNQLKVDKIYLETHRDLLIVPDETLEQAKKYFRDKGIEVGGGITYTINEANNFETFCYSDPEHRKIVQEIAEHTARHFDDFILDDFFFTSCKSDIEIKAKGTKSWTQYRTELMTKAGMDLILKPAKKINPNVKVIIKYPNWYDHFQGLGFDLNNGPQLFDAIWSGTETRDPASDQHLQNYLSYNVVRYFDNLRPGANLGGWVDSGGSHMGMDRYAEQLWLSMFAKAPEIALFAYHQLLGTTLRPEIHRTPWQGQGTSFDYDEMMKPIRVDNGQIITPTTIARVADVALTQVDQFVHKLGKPVGIKSYKPFHSLGDDFLQNYLGMIGLPMDMYPAFPTDQQVVILTEQAKYDPDIIAKIKVQLQKGGDVVITSSLLKAIPEKIAAIAELRVTDLKALVNDFGNAGTIDKDILIPQVRYQTNDAWEIVSAGRPLSKGVSGYPMLLRAPYSKGNMYIMTIPDDFGNLYDLPTDVLNVFRQICSKDLGMYIEGPAKVGLFLYDNDTFILESFLDEPVTIQLVTDANVSYITDILQGLKIEKLTQEVVRPGFRRISSNSQVNRFRITLKPHSYRVFEKKSHISSTSSGPGDKTTQEQGFVGKHGRLTVKHGQLTDEYNQPIVLRGVSFGWHIWWPGYYNANAVRQIASDWNATLIRAAIGVEPENGYLDNPEMAMRCLTNVVDAAIEQGVYVIIDWHSHGIRLEEAKRFFRTVAQKYKDTPNVIYELFNEPVHQSWEEVKEYSLELIKVIREIDTDNIILVGCPQWCQDIQSPADDPIVGYDNLMYVMHFYAGTHKQWLRDRTDYALSKGLPVFVSECAGMEASGDGPIDINEWNSYADWMNDRKLSWAAWSVSGKDESCSMLKVGTNPATDWTDNELKEWARIVKMRLSKDNK